MPDPTLEVLDELVKALMAADRRAQDLEDRANGLDPARLVDDADAEMNILCVDGDDRLYKGMAKLGLKGFHFSYAQSGGEALDRISNQRIHIALVGPSIVDLPSEMVISAIKSASPELIAISYVPNGRLAIIEASTTIVIAEKFTNANQLRERLAELAEAHRERRRERRYLQAFRERHYDLLRRVAELKQKLSAG
jgi:DNA-binding NtrC family response regulator